MKIMRTEHVRTNASKMSFRGEKENIETVITSLEKQFETIHQEAIDLANAGKNLTNEADVIKNFDLRDIKFGQLLSTLRQLTNFRNLLKKF